LSTNEIQSLERAFTILDCFQDSQPELGVREIARQLELPPSTVGRILTTLNSFGVLNQDKETHRYRIGPKVLEWCATFTRNVDLQTEARPYMQELQRITEETISLDIPNGHSRICIERIVSPQSLRWVKQLGEIMPFYASASGRVLLSFMSPEEKNEILKNMNFEQLTPYTITDPNVFHEELELSKSQGYAVSTGERVEGVSCVAAPIFGVKGEILGAITISGPSIRFSEQKIQEHVELLMKTTKQISQAMGSHLSESQEELYSPSELSLQQ